MRTLLPKAALLLVLLGFGSSARSQQSGLPVALAAAYRNKAADGGRASIERATDQALSEAGPLVRALARPRLLENNPPVAGLTIEIDGATARVTYEGQRSYRGPIGGNRSVEQRSPDGSTVRVRYLVEGSALVEIAEAGGGTGRIRYELQGDELVVRTVIESRHLPAPVRFVLRFARADRRPASRA